MHSSNWDSSTMAPATRPTVHRNNNHQHTMSASQIPSFMNRNIPSYYVTGEHSPQSNNSSTSPSAPRYSPQPWKRQHSHGSLSFMTSPRPEQSDYTTSQQPRRPADRAPVCLSPFRSVRKMKQPFQLMLPTSPSRENTPTFAKEQKAPRQTSGNHGLRTWRSDQNLVNASLESFGLLPSPPLSDSHTSHPSSSSAYFSPNPDSEYEKDHETTKACGCAPGRKPCNNCDVPKPSTQDGGQKKTEEATNVQMAHSTLVKRCDEINDSESSPPAAETEPVAQSPSLGTTGEEEVSVSDSPANAQRTRAGTASSAASWVPDNFSYCQNWLQGVETMDVKGQKSKEVNRRKFQIVQVAHSSPPANHDVKDVKLAVASKTKPKLVDISSHQSSPSMGSSPNQQHLVPSTPDHRQQEISAFSPDTPLEMSDSGYTTQQSCFSPGDSQEDKEDDGYTDASSMTSESVSSTIVCDKPVLNPEKPASSLKTELPSKITLSPKPEASPGSASNMSEKEQLEKWWDHEWTIDQLEHSVKDFPHHKLKLTSPVIMFLRKNDEKSLIRPFRKIFPDAAENPLDSLCAALIARNYIVELSSNHRRNSGFSHKPTLSRLDTPSEKAGSNLGIHFAQASPSQIKDRVLGSRSAELRKELNQIIDSLLISVCGRPDETLKSAVLVLAQVLEAK